MDDDDNIDALSDASSTILEELESDIDVLARLENEVTEDLTNGEVIDIRDGEDGSSDVVPDVGKDEESGQSQRVPVKPRGYQMEMLEESLKKNIIVAMDTGSGKTHVACMRICHELDVMQPHQLVWFLAPKVALGAQQFEYLCSQITSVQIKFLSGADGCDRWTDQQLWDALLADVKVVVSTPKILLDALTHGFVRLSQLSLLIFDEAHNCTGKSSEAKIMSNFYHKAKAEGEDVPNILGLTASPLMKSNPNSLQEIESIVDSICRTPTRHRLELRSQVKLPAFQQVFYRAASEDDFQSPIPSLSKLRTALLGLKIMEDPYVLALKADDSEKSQRTLAKVLLNHKTWVQAQMKRFLRTSITILEELGPWAVEYYINRVILNVTSAEDHSGLDGYTGLWDVSGSEKQYLTGILRRIATDASSSESSSLPVISDKVSCLVKELLKQDDDMRGIVFVNQRATAEVLAVLLRTHTSTKDKLRLGTFVGTSTNARRTREISDVVDFEVQKHVLDKFRKGEINIVIATDVLEEGIDVPACNLVVCFDSPKNLKSFVQRRGRARQKESKLVMFFDQQKDQKSLSEYQQLEEKMKQIYEEENRQLLELLANEDEEEGGQRFYRIPTTGALLDLDNAKSHLYHFCATLPAKQFVDLRPEFICENEDGLITARVILPLSVDESVRTARSPTYWKSEQNAIKDASFEAYVALHKAGLVGDSLLPLMRHDGEAEDLLASTMQKRASMMEVRDELNPWIDISKSWANDPNIYKSLLKVGEVDIEILLPVKLPAIQQFNLFWDSTTVLRVTIEPSEITTKDTLQIAVASTHKILTSAFGHRFQIREQQQPASFLVDVPSTLTELRQHKAVEDSLRVGVIRDTANPQFSHSFMGYLDRKPPIELVRHPYVDYATISSEEPHYSVKRLPKRHNFLQKVVSGTSSSTKQYSAVVPVCRALLGDLPFAYIRFALMLPSILRRLSIYLLVHRLSETVLKDIKLASVELVRTAICASSAQEPTNYQRLEFLGDSILKLCTSIQLFDEFPLWHEGLLSFKKDRIVSNGRLAKAAVEAGLDSFIITKQFTGHKWRPSYAEDLASMSEGYATRQMSSKILADVVESLVGAAMVDGGIDKSLKYLSALLPEMDWQSLAGRRASMYGRVPDVPLPAILKPLETLLGYTFTKGSLLVAALTHASSLNSTSGSLGRLEFLGDAILDNIIVTEMWDYKLCHYQMHLLRTAMVNADYLAWLCLESSIEQVSTNVDPESLSIETSTERWPLWRFLRHSSSALARAQQTATARHLLLRDEINKAIISGTHYPWALLARLEAGKFFSDMIESLLGAIWIDSHSTTPVTQAPRSNDTGKTEHSNLQEEPIFATCKAVLERLGVLPYMRRILHDNVHILHPKEELGILADCETVKYVISARKRTDGEGVEYLCTVSVGGVEVVSVDGGVNKAEVKTKAAERAVQILKARKGSNLRKRKTPESDEADVVRGEGGADDVMDLDG